MSTPIQGLSLSSIQAARPATARQPVKPESPEAVKEPSDVSISSAAAALAEQSTPLPPDMAKVERFQQMIADGSYQPSSRSIANSMLSEALQTGPKTR